MANNTLITFDHVTKQYATEDGIVAVLKDVNFSVERNSFTIIFGPSGSGKTTILNIILGLLPITSGRVVVDGTDMFRLTQNERAKFRAREYGTVYQTNNWVASLDVIENIALPLYLSGYDRTAANKKAMASLQKVGLEKYARYNPQVLSVGQQQRVSMARATVSEPSLLIADEPTGNLDSKNSDKIMRLLMAYKNEHNATVILVTHNSDFLPLSDHRLFIEDGIVSEVSGGYRADTTDKYNTVANMISLSKSAKRVIGK